VYERAQGRTCLPCLAAARSRYKEKNRA
jgi:hypothetical protein